MDVLPNWSPEQILSADLPFVMDMVKSKVRLEEAKHKAQKAAQDLANSKAGGHPPRK